MCCVNSYPLMNMPLPGNAPLQFVTAVDGYKVPPSLSLTDVQESTDGHVKIPRWVSLSSVLLTNVPPDWSLNIQYHSPTCRLIGRLTFNITHQRAA